MLLENYRLEIFNSACNPGAMGVHCFAYLDQDVSPAIPYLIIKARMVLKRRR